MSRLSALGDSQPRHATGATGRPLSNQCPSFAIALPSSPILFSRPAGFPTERFSANLEVLLPPHDVRSPPRYASAADLHWLRKLAHCHFPVNGRDVERGHLLDRVLV